MCIRDSSTTARRESTGLACGLSTFLSAGVNGMACICEFAAIPSAERVDAECGERRQQRGETRSKYRPQPCWAERESRPRRIPQRPLSGYLEYIVAARVGKSFTRAPMAERMV